jgi:hypothetical protein
MEELKKQLTPEAQDKVAERSVMKQVSAGGKR